MEKIKEYLLENIGTLRDIVNELNTYNNCLDNLYFYENDEYFFDFFKEKPYELARAICYGDYNLNYELVQIDVYGNLKSINNDDYDNELKDYIDEIIDNLLEYMEDITIYDKELEKMLKEEVKLCER